MADHSFLLIESPLLDPFIGPPIEPTRHDKA
jgi:hypothetical protein